MRIKMSDEMRIYAYDKILEIINKMARKELLVAIKRSIQIDISECIDEKYLQFKDNNLFPFYYLNNKIVIYVDIDNAKSHFFDKVIDKYSEYKIECVTINGKEKENRFYENISMHAIKLQELRERIDLRERNFYEIFEKANILKLKDKYIEKLQTKHVYKYKKLKYDCPSGLCNIPQRFLASGVENNEIFFSSPKMLNDPFECSVSVGDEFSFEQDNSFKIFSTSFLKNDILMWPYYADSYEGVCLEYSFNEIKEALINRGGDFYIGNVIYTSKRVTTDLLEIYKSFLDKKSAEIMFKLNIMFTKSNDWKHEKEFRFVIEDDKAENKNGVVVSGVQVTDLIIGYKTDVNILQQVNNRFFAGPTYKMVKPNNSKYKLDII